MTSKGVRYCNATFDSFLCWPPTEAGKTAFQNCPAERLSDTSRLAFRRCGLNGMWLGRRKNEYSVVGWTNYTPCFPTEVQNLIGKVYDGRTDPQAKFQIALITRYIEIIGFSVSLISVSASLFIFLYFRTLRNPRTRIHTNLFIATLIQIILRLVLYSDQEVVRSEGKTGKISWGIMGMPYACIGCYILLEYAISSMFAWMFIEGFFLYNVLVASSLRERITYLQYCVLGWGFPVFTTGGWVAANYIHYGNETIDQCWYGYNFLGVYWVVQGPRVMTVVINFLFLAKIITVLLSKLQATERNETNMAKKAVHAAMVLLPLLGITNIFNMIEPPIDGSVWVFALWSFTTHFLRSFEGFFISLIYCFLNAEVREVISKLYNDWKTIREDERRMREQTSQINRQRRELNVPDNEQALFSEPRVLDNLPVLTMDNANDFSRVSSSGDLCETTVPDTTTDIERANGDESRRRHSRDSIIVAGVPIQVAADINLSYYRGNDCVADIEADEATTEL